MSSSIKTFKIYPGSKNACTQIHTHKISVSHLEFSCDSNNMGEVMWLKGNGTHIFYRKSVSALLINIKDIIHKPPVIREGSYASQHFYMPRGPKLSFLHIFKPQRHRYLSRYDSSSLCIKKKRNRSIIFKARAGIKTWRESFSQLHSGCLCKTSAQGQQDPHTEHLRKRWANTTSAQPSGYGSHKNVKPSLVSEEGYREKLWESLSFYTAIRMTLVFSFSTFVERKVTVYTTDEKQITSICVKETWHRSFYINNCNTVVYPTSHHLL